MLPYHKYAKPYYPLVEQLDENDQSIARHEPYNALDAIPMLYDICYRDNDIKEGKHKCDDEILRDLDVLQSKGFTENELADVLHRPIRRKENSNSRNNIPFLPDNVRGLIIRRSMDFYTTRPVNPQTTQNNVETKFQFEIS